MTTLWIDVETYSEVPISHGTYRYAENSELLLFAFALDDGEVEVLDVSDTPMPHSIQWLVDEADEVVIHNSMFDRNVLKHCGVNVPIEKIQDTAVQALAHSLPPALDKLCDVLKVPFDKAKSKDGKRLINLFTKPRPKKMKLRRATKHTHPEDWAAFIEYARLDIEAMRECRARMPTWNNTPSERRLWLLDQKINDRGVAVDLDLARAALRAAERTSADLAAKTKDLTCGAVGSTTQRDALIDYLAESEDFAVSDMRKGTVAKLLEDEDLSDNVKALLENRQQAAATSPAKYRTLLNGVSADGRLRGTLQFCGASRTSRWGGRLFQPQNLPRPTLPHDVIERGICAMKLDCEHILFDNVMELCASAVRGSLVAPPGRKLVISDLSNIEGRVLAWLAGEDWKTKAFRDFDRGIGHDIYVLAYARAFGVDPQAVIDNKKNGDGSMRQLGKVMELALGYQGSIGAFNSMAALYGIELSDERVLEIVQAWRKAHPAIKNFWYDVEGAARQVRALPDETRQVGLLTFDMKDGWLRMRLPSGRYLNYPWARKDEITTRIMYWGVNQYTRKWEELETYGGKLVENAVQAVARDVLAHGMTLAEKEGFDVCLHVHDELITEGGPRQTVEMLSNIMSRNPSWALGLPLAAAGFTCDRYRKD